jgi:hypothetical protein
MSNITFNPMLTTSPSSTFQATTNGYVQGAFQDDPSVKNELCSGQIASSVTGPVWAGMAIQELVPTVNSNQAGNNLVLATGPSTYDGFTVLNQANNGIITPGNSVAQYGAGMTISYFRDKSNARIGVQCTAALANAIGGGDVDQQVGWDYTQQMLVPYSAGYTGTITGATWSANVAVFTVGTDPTTNVPVGSYITVTGVVSSGGSATTAYNGSWLVTARNTTTITVSLVAASTPGTYVSGGTAALAANLLPVKVLNANTNSKIVSYNSTTGVLSYSVGPVAIIQI